MNLHAIVGNSIAQINPYVLGNYQQSSGYTTLPDGSRVPAYDPGVTVQIQKQPLTYKELTQTDSLNISGEKAAFYINGNWQGISRPTSQGGDIITLQNGTVWLVVMLLENWSEMDGWSKVCVTLQNNK